MSTINYIPLVDCPKVSPEAASNNDWWINAVPVPTPCQPCSPCCESQEEKEQTMRYDFDTDTAEGIKLDHLCNRMSNVFYTKQEALRKQFGLVDDDPPNTVKAFLARIAEGKYTVTEENMERVAYDPSRLIRWRNPAMKEDREGFKAAEKALTAARTAAEDIIVVMSDEAARLKALQEFESATVN